MLKKKFKIIWASTREVLNIFQADKLECHIITVGHDFIKKLENSDNTRSIIKITMEAIELIKEHGMTVPHIDPSDYEKILR